MHCNTSYLTRLSTTLHQFSDATYLGMNRRQSSQRMTGIGPGTGGTPKQSGVIDVIGGTQRDSRRPQQEFTEVPTRLALDYFNYFNYFCSYCFQDAGVFLFNSVALLIV